jgi:hypothetical protein
MNRRNQDVTEAITRCRGRGDCGDGGGRMALRELAVADYIHCGGFVTVLWG